jgi:hypothetical protein
VNDDLSIPTVSAPYWQTTNSFRSSGLSHRYADVNLVPSFVDACEDECADGVAILDVELSNGGNDDVPAGVALDLLAGSNGPVVATATTTQPVPGHGTGEVLRFSVPAANLAGQTPAVRVDPMADVDQCRLDDDVATWTGPVCQGG